VFEVKKAGEIISALFKEKFGPELMETACSSAGLFSSWTSIVTEVLSYRAGYGAVQDTEQSRDDIPAAASHSQIRELERGILLIEADHPGWVQILQTKQAQLLSVVQRRYPKLGIHGIAFRLCRGPEKITK
jgi:hypothetical protein